MMICVNSEKDDYGVWVSIQKKSFCKKICIFEVNLPLEDRVTTKKQPYLLQSLSFSSNAFSTNSF